MSNFVEKFRFFLAHSCSIINILIERGVYILNSFKRYKLIFIAAVFLLILFSIDRNLIHYGTRGAGMTLYSFATIGLAYEIVQYFRKQKSNKKTKNDNKDDK